MKVENKVIPSEEQMKGFVEGDIDSPISMLNLLKFKDQAEYEDGRTTDLTGREAYQIYALAVAKLVENTGGKVLFGAEVSRLMLGEVEELWDTVAIAQYPSRRKMLEMMMSPEYAEISVHRTAGLKGQLNIETKNHE
ncbi:MAG: DUF1330 domain-containing protein [Gammaproteobacteria bacterium]|jgi:uncharacterized protein (DUF1330 family)|nr:DUF1330 domain-containing protein [Gammaproteobacteria bacterium]|tara:strand:- start:28729 stop:29139 length:411 start_codon:yes stop_codon:yes gene_type:complete